jgi:hypothetical protein
VGIPLQKVAELGGSEGTRRIEVTNALEEARQLIESSLKLRVASAIPV